MAEGKKIVSVYVEWGDLFDKLDDDEAGRLIKHFFKYVNDLDPVAPDKLTDLLFEPIQKQLQRDLKKWESIRDRNQENGKKGGRPKNNPENPVGILGYSEKPKKAVEVEVEVEDKDIINTKTANSSPRFKPSLDFIENLEFRNIVTDWVHYKIEIKDAYKSQKSIDAFFKHLFKLSNGDQNAAREIINTSIANNWKGIFQINNNQTNGQKFTNHSDADQQNQINRNYIADKYARAKAEISGNN